MVLKRLKQWFSANAKAKRQAKRRTDRRRRLEVEVLEERYVLTSTLYLDFGEFFPTGGLQMTQTQLSNTFAGNGLQGPNMIGLASGPPISGTTPYIFNSLQSRTTFDYNGDGAVNATDYTNLRDNIVSLVQRFYQPFDVTVVAAPLLTNTSSAAYMTNVRAVLSGGSPAVGEGDAWVFIADVIRTDAVTGPSSMGFATGTYGIAPGNDAFLGANVRDDVSIAFLDTLLSDFGDATADTAIARTAAHEAAHTFGLVHSLAQPGTSDQILLSLSDLMNAIAPDVSRTNIGMFTRYPLANQSAPTTALNQAALLLNPMLLGPGAGAAAYVTGTGANDIITISAAGAGTATVTVQAYRDAAYTSLVNVPSSVPVTGTFSYTVSTANGILIEGGLGNDRVIINSNINVNVEVRGMAGDDQLIVLGNNGATGSYVVDSTATAGLDGLVAYGGVITIGATNITIKEFETTGSVTVQDVNTFTLRTPNAADVLTFDAPLAGRVRVSGTSGGVGVVPLTFFNVVNFTLDSATVDAGLGGAANDVITVSATGASLLQNFSINTGDGDDRLTSNLQSFILPAAGGALTFNAGGNSDTLVTNNDVTTLTLNAGSLVNSAGGTLTFNGVEAARLNGGASGNTFVVNAFAGTVDIFGAAGTDSLQVAAGNVAAGTYTPGAVASNGLVGTLATSALALSFAQFEAASTITVQNLTNLSVQSLSTDVFTIDSPLAGRSRISGTSGGTAIVAMTFFNVTNFAVNTGDFDDTLILGLNSFLLPGTTGTFTIDAGTQGAVGDTLRVTNNVTLLTLTTASLMSSSGGMIGLNSLEIAELTGGAADNGFTVNSWTGRVTLTGNGGNDAFTIGAGDLDAIAGSVAVSAGAGGNDSITLGDGGNAVSANYTVDVDAVTTVLTTGFARSFTGLTYDGANTETLTLNANQSENVIQLIPSETTTFNVNGNTPVPGGAARDYLLLDFIGTGGRTKVYNAGTGDGSWTFPGSGAPVTGIRRTVNFTSIEQLNDFIAFSAAGRDAGSTSQPYVKIIDLISGEVIEFLAYEATFRGGVQTVMADLTGDGVAEIITAPGRTRAPEIRVFNNVGVELTSFRTMAYAANNLNGVNVGAADVNGDGKIDIITAPDRGVVEVRVFQNQFGLNADSIIDTPIFRFNAFGTNFIGGATVTGTDLNGDGRAEIIVGSGSGMVSTVMVFNPLELPAIPVGTPTPVAPPTAFAKLANFFATNFLGGVNVSAGRVNADGTADIIVAQRQGGSSLVAVLDGASGRRQVDGTFNPTSLLVGPFAAFIDSGSTAGVAIVARDVDGDGIIDFLYTGQTSDGRTKNLINFYTTNNTLSVRTSVPLFGNQSFPGFGLG